MAVSKKVKKQDEPVKAEPVKAEPVKAEPVKAEPKNAEPKKAEPKKAEPKKAEPKNAEPKKAEPKKAEPKKAEPAFEVDEEVLYESKISKVLAVAYKESLGYRVKLLCEGQIISVSEELVSKK
jgi:hypothetical protein